MYFQWPAWTLNIHYTLYQRTFILHGCMLCPESFLYLRESEEEKKSLCKSKYFMTWKHIFDFFNTFVFDSHTKCLPTLKPNANEMTQKYEKLFCNHQRPETTTTYCILHKVLEYCIAKLKKHGFVPCLTTRLNLIHIFRRTSGKSTCECSKKLPETMR